MISHETYICQAVIMVTRRLAGKPPSPTRPVAVHRVRATDLPDEWVREAARPDSLLLLEHAALVRAYAALLATAHHE